MQESTTPNIDLLKVREMPERASLVVTTNDKGEVCLSPQARVRGLDKQTYRPTDLRAEVEPWLTALFQSEHLSLLAGAGLTNAVHFHITGALPAGFANRTYKVFDNEIQKEAFESAKRTGRGTPNAEDQMRAALMLSDGLRILLATEDDGKAPKEMKALRQQLKELTSDIDDAIEHLLSGLLQAERSIREGAEPNREEALRELVSFLMSFASRTGTRDRLHLFTTNYDRILEFGAELAGMRLIDRFVGSLAPIFRSSRLDLDLHYNPPGIRGEPRYVEGVARFTKLHGSIDWMQDGREVRRCSLPFGTSDHKPYLGANPRQSLVYPNDAKDRETSSYPYVELFRDFAAAICRPNSTLVTYGYSFGDEHLNRVILDMLTVPSTHLVMINYDDTGGRLIRFYEDSRRPSQISLMVGRHLGDLTSLVDNYLPKPAIDRSTIRMADLLRARGYTDVKPLPHGHAEQEECLP